MQLSHKIRINPDKTQTLALKKACGASRFTWNWALAEWNKEYAQGLKPNAFALKKRFNAIKYQEFPWLKEIPRDAHARPFENLARAWGRFFKGQGEEPAFKKKEKCRESFYIANDKFSIKGKTVRLPRIGNVPMTEALRFHGKILGASVSERAGKWFLSVQVEIPDREAARTRTGNGVIGVDLGITALATLSNGEKIPSSKPLRKALRRLKIRSRSLSRKLEAAKEAVGIKKNGKIPKGTRLPVLSNRKKARLCLGRLHARIVNIRADVLHKLTTRLCRENQAVALEDLNVKGMVRNRRLALAISDAGFGEFKRQMAYKALLYGTKLVFADRWFPSSKTCSSCGTKNDTLTLSDRLWTCPSCGMSHDRDKNAALNLRRLATVTALPVARLPGNGGAALGILPMAVGKVTPVRYDLIQGSGREENRVHKCTLS